MTDLEPAVPGGVAAGAERERERVPAKVSVDGTCAECGQEQLCRYPVLSANGWFEVVKCQSCLASVSREPWFRLGWVRLPEDLA